MDIEQTEEYSIERLVKHMVSLDFDYLSTLNTTLSEWTSDEDDQAYKNL